MLMERGLLLDGRCQEVQRLAELQANLERWKTPRHWTLDHGHYYSVPARYLTSRGQYYSVYSSLRGHLSPVCWYGWLGRWGLISRKSMDATGESRNMYGDRWNDGSRIRQILIGPKKRTLVEIRNCCPVTNLAFDQEVVGELIELGSLRHTWKMAIELGGHDS